MKIIALLLTLSLAACSGDDSSGTKDRAGFNGSGKLTDVPDHTGNLTSDDKEAFKTLGNELTQITNYQEEAKSNKITKCNYISSQTPENDPNHTLTEEISGSSCPIFYEARTVQRGSQTETPDSLTLEASFDGSGTLKVDKPQQFAGNKLSTLQESFNGNVKFKFYLKNDKLHTSEDGTVMGTIMATDLFGNQAKIDFGVTSSGSTEDKIEGTYKFSVETNSLKATLLVAVERIGENETRITKMALNGNVVPEDQWNELPSFDITTKTTQGLKNNNLNSFLQR